MLLPWASATPTIHEERTNSVSAWRVSKADIDGLIQYAMAEGLIDMDKRNEWGLKLDVENQLSLRARYGDEMTDSEYTFAGIEAPLDDLKLLKHAMCYEYQTCEHDAWAADDNDVRLLIERIQLHAIHKLGYEDWDHCYVVARQTRAWTDAPWGITHLRELLPTDERLVGSEQG